MNKLCTVPDVRHTKPLDNGYPSKIFLETTTRCNLSCRMCVKQGTEEGIPEGNFSPDLFEALVPALSHLDALILNGIGEPLLSPFLEEFIIRAKKMMPGHAWTGFQSNGILMSKDRAFSLVEAGLDRICLSVDSVTTRNFSEIREGGNFGDIERAFQALNQAKIKSGRHCPEIGIEFVLMRENFHELPATIRWASERGASFAIVTQVLPYNRSLAGQAVYDTNTDGAISVYRTWQRRALEEGIDLRRYFDVFMKYWKSEEEEKIVEYINNMKSEAGVREIALHLERLLRRDEALFSSIDEVFAEVQDIALKTGMEIKLPELAPKNSRNCEFVESHSAFVSWDGKVHPCYFLWHRYGCYVGGWDKFVKPQVFGSLAENDIISIWNCGEYRSFREQVLRYDFPFCFDCSFALCDYVSGEDFEQDCYVRSVPCGACLWCTGLFHCLQ